MIEWHGWQTIQALVIGAVFTGVIKLFWDSWRDR